MAVLFRTFFIIFLFSIVEAVADGSKWAGLRIANCIGMSPQALQVEINAQAWSEKGLMSGEVSGLRRVEPGQLRLSFSQDGLVGREVRLTIKPDQMVTLVPHAHRLQGSPGWEIRVLKLDALPEGDGRMATVVDVGFAARRLLEIKQLGKSWTTMALRHLEPQRFRIDQHRGYLPMRVGRQRLDSIPVFEQGHHVVVLYDVEGGGLGSLFFRDRAWPAPPVLKAQP